MFEPRSEHLVPVVVQIFEKKMMIQNGAVSDCPVSALHSKLSQKHSHMRTVSKTQSHANKANMMSTTQPCGAERTIPLLIFERVKAAFILCLFAD